MKKKIAYHWLWVCRRRFAILTKKNFKNLDINILTKQKKIGFKVIKNIRDIKELNPDFIIISSPTNFHFYHLQLVNRF